MFDKRDRRVGNRTTCRDHPNYGITEIDQNAEKSPRDLRRLAVSQIPEKDYQLIQV